MHNLNGLSLMKATILRVSYAKDEASAFSRSIPTPQKGSDILNQTKLLFPLIFISLEDDSSIVIPPQPTSPGEIMSGGEGEPVENEPIEEETVSP